MLVSECANAFQFRSAAKDSQGLNLWLCRDCIGDCVLAGDFRWAGTFGVNLDFVARSHCSIEFIATEAMQVESSRLE